MVSRRAARRGTSAISRALRRGWRLLDCMLFAPAAGTPPGLPNGTWESAEPARLRHVAAIAADGRSLVLRPSACQPAVSLVRLNARTALTDVRGRPFAVAALRPGMMITLRVARAPDGQAVAQVIRAQPQRDPVHEPVG